MAAGIIYRIQGTNVEGKFFKVDILDNAVQTVGTPQVIELDGSGTPVVLSSVDNSEGKFTALRSQQCTIKFLSDGVYGVKTFSGGFDKRFQVIVLYDTTIVFEGFLLQDDSQQPFMDGRNEVTLTANDGLAGLKDVDLIDFNGDQPAGKYTMAQLAAMCLALTGTPKQLKIINSLVHGSGINVTTNVLFEGADNSISFDFNASYFYPDMILEISGSVSNNMTTRVKSIESSTKIIVDATLTDESATLYNITFSDISSLKHFFEHSIEIKSAEKEVTTLLNPYDLLNKLLGTMHELFYMDSAWWIVRKADKYRDPVNVAVFSAEGEYQLTQELSFPKAFGIDETHWFAEERTDVIPTREIGKLVLSYAYEYPEEIACNGSFTRGDFIEDLPAEQIDDNYYNAKKYELDCWGAVDVDLSDGTESTGTQDKFIKKLTNEQGYEKSSSAVIDFGSYNAASQQWIKSQGIPMGKGDKFTLSADWHIENNVTGDDETGFRAFLVTLNGVDGNQYAWARGLDEDPFDVFIYKWRLYADVVGFVSKNYLYVPDNVNTSEWQSVSVDIGELPVAGEVFIHLANWAQNIGDIPQDTYWSNLSVDYKPKINNSFQLYNKETHTITRPEVANQVYSNKKEFDATPADAPRPLFKWALFYENGGIYYLTQRWHEPDDTARRRPLLWWKAFDIWNQYRNGATVLEFFAAGVGTEWPHIVHHIDVTDIDALTVGRLFEIITFEKDLKLCTISGNMPELYRGGYDYSDPYEFKYLT